MTPLCSIYEYMVAFNQIKQFSSIRFRRTVEKYVEKSVRLRMVRNKELFLVTVHQYHVGHKIVFNILNLASRLFGSLLVMACGHLCENFHFALLLYRLNACGLI